MLSTVAAILISFSIIGLWRVAVDVFFERAKYWGMKKKKTTAA